MTADGDSIGREPAFDPERLTKLFNYDYGSIADILETAFDSLRELIDRLSAQLGLGNRQASLELSHELKGTSANIGALQLAESSRVLELRLRGKELASDAGELVALNQAYDHFVTEAKRYLGTLPGRAS